MKATLKDGTVLEGGVVELKEFFTIATTPAAKLQGATRRRGSSYAQVLAATKELLRVASEPIATNKVLSLLRDRGVLASESTVHRALHECPAIKEHPQRLRHGQKQWVYSRVSWWDKATPREREDRIKKMQAARGIV